jgi:hypothetical protein
MQKRMIIALISSSRTTCSDEIEKLELIVGDANAARLAREEKIRQLEILKISQAAAEEEIAIAVEFLQAQGRQYMEAVKVRDALNGGKKKGKKGGKAKKAK